MISLRNKSGESIPNLRYFDFKAKRLWFVMFNRTEATTLKATAQGKFSRVERFENPQGNWANSDLESDRAGRGSSSASGGGRGTIHHLLDRKVSKTDVIARRFARKVALFLLTAKGKDRFEELVLVAEPHLLGVLKKNLPATLRKSVIRDLPREYPQGKDHKIQVVLRKSWLKFGA